MYFLCFRKIRKDEQGIAAHKSAKKKVRYKLKALCTEEPWGYICLLRVHGKTSWGLASSLKGENRKVVPRENLEGNKYSHIYITL